VLVIKHCEINHFVEPNCRPRRDTIKVQLVYLSKVPGNRPLFRLAPLTHPLLAAYTPPDIEVSLVDEAFELIDVDGDADLVALTFVVPLANRAYHLARQLRERGKTVVAGGPHVSLLPDEAAVYFDAVVIGEGDLLWPQLLNDFRSGCLKKYYRNTHPINPEQIPIPRRDLLHQKRYTVLNTVQATRGCPFACAFCTTRRVYPGFQTRPIRNVVEELEQAAGGAFQQRVIMFWDDNLMGNPLWAEKLFQEMVPLNKIWFGQCTFNIAKDRALVRLAAKSGCRGLFFGLESFNSLSLKNNGKSHNDVRAYEDGIKFLHDSGISVYAGIMLGFDDDRKDIFEITMEQLNRLGVDMIAPRIVVPYPNTPFFSKLVQDNRIIHRDWSKYDGSHAVFHPRHMAAAELEEGFRWFDRKFHSSRSIATRLFKSRTFPWLSVPINLSKNSWVEKIFTDRNPSDRGYPIRAAFTEDF